MPGRKYTRLKHYDYATPGAYFVTACTDERRSTLGRIIDGRLDPTELGRLVESRLAAISQHHGRHIVVDSHVVMPNHVHMILFILPTLKEKKEVRAGQPPAELNSSAPDDHAIGTMAGGTATSGSLGAIVGSFKASVTRLWRERNPMDSTAIWQTSFHEHVVRHEKALERIREYIVNNQRQWELDRENPERRGEHEIYRWLAEYYRRTGI